MPFRILTLPVSFFLASDIHNATRGRKTLATHDCQRNDVLDGPVIFVLFGLANFIHAITFYHTLKNFLGGATSAGVMKGLQAVLVFLFTHRAFCGREGGSEMCITRTKFVSLVTVVGGVVGYGFATERKKEGYERISSEDQLVELLNSSSLPQTRKRSKDDEDI